MVSDAISLRNRLFFAPASFNVCTFYFILRVLFFTKYFFHIGTVEPRKDTASCINL